MPICVFCEIVAGTLPAFKIYEDELTVVFLDIHPNAPGHALLIPKTHVARVEELKPEDSQALFRALYRVLSPIREGVGADATTIGINNGPGSGQEIPHVHIHIIPRRRGDGGYVIQALGPGSGQGNLDEVAKKIKQRIGVL